MKFFNLHSFLQKSRLMISCPCVYAPNNFETIWYISMTLHINIMYFSIPYH